MTDYGNSFSVQMDSTSGVLGDICFACGGELTAPAGGQHEKTSRERGNPTTSGVTHQRHPLPEQVPTDRGRVASRVTR
eukprot:6143346-Amphidinium_carterae.1